MERYLSLRFLKLFQKVQIDMSKKRNQIYYLAAETAFITGLRIGEVCGIMTDELIDYTMEKENVKKTYSAIGMDDPSTLRMMEKEELDCFKKLTQAKNRALLDDVIRTYSAIGMKTIQHSG